MKAQNLNPIILLGTCVCTAIALFALYGQHRDRGQTTPYKDMHITDLAPIEVHPEKAAPSKAGQRASQGMISSLTMPRLPSSTSTGKLLSEPLAMPFYSFANKIARSTKE